jgi:hypothetical protein
MRDALRDPEVFGEVMSGSSWDSWRVLLTASCGERLTDSERAIFTALTGREREPGDGRMVEEFWACLGRRSGKSRACAVWASYLAGLCDYHDLAPGERPSALLMSASLAQSTKLFQYVRGIFEHVAVLRSMVQAETGESLSLSNGVDIECVPASFRTTRGRTLCAALCDEISFWRVEGDSRNPDVLILESLRPALATMGAPLIALSSPYGKRGALWDAVRRDYGPDGDPAILIAKGSSRALNPLLPEKVVARAYSRDAAAADAEFGGNFRSDVSGFLDHETVAFAVDRGVLVRPPRAGVRYRSGCDPSGGSRDSFTLAIAHVEGDTAVLDCLVEIRAPFNPTSATAQIAATLRSYWLTRTVGDRYAAEWVVDAFRKVGIVYEHSERDRSAVYLDMLPKFTSGCVRLLDNARLVNQLTSLERRTGPSGRDKVDHGPGPHAHDDAANSCALALTCKGQQAMRISEEFMRKAAAMNLRGDVYC